jgi:transposase-like protein
MKRHTAKQIIDKLRLAERLRAEGNTVEEVARQLEITDQTYYRWKRKYGDSSKSEVAKLRHLQRENEQLKKLVADLSLDKQILKDALEGKY